MMFPKPSKGSARAEKLALRAQIERLEARAKLSAKVRDGYRCRVPGCATNLQAWRLESAHLVDKGMGGDHGRYSCEPKHFVTLCHDCHQWPRSVHSGHLRMVYGPEMGDGPVEFVTR